MLFSLQMQFETITSSAVFFAAFPLSALLFLNVLGSTLMALPALPNLDEVVVVDDEEEVGLFGNADGVTTYLSFLIFSPQYSSQTQKLSWAFPTIVYSCGQFTILCCFLETLSGIAAG